MRKLFLLIPLLLFISSCAENVTETAVVQDKKFKWSLVTTWPKNLPGLGMAPERFSRLVQEMSSGQLEIKVYGAGEIVPAMGCLLYTSPSPRDREKSRMPSSA